MIVGFRHISAVGLVLAVIAMGVSAPALDFAGHPAAGCHAMSHPQSSLSPVDYQCCQAGHNAAVVKSLMDSANMSSASHLDPGFETVLGFQRSSSLPVRMGHPPVS